jgi:hypothetical protein
MKTTLSLVVTLIFGAMFLVSFQTDSHIMTAEMPQNSEEAELFLASTTESIVTGTVDNFYNYPEPFCGKTTIYYKIDEVTNVRLTVIGPSTGIINLVNTQLKPGVYSVEFDACKLPCGDYTAYLVTDYGKYVEHMKKIISVHKIKYSKE